MNENHSTINVKSQIQNPDSIFAHYQKLVQMRKELDVIAYGSICPLAEKHPGVFAYMREYEGHRLLVVNNFYAKECSWESGLDVSRISVYVKQLSERQQSAERCMEIACI